MRSTQGRVGENSNDIRIIRVITQFGFERNPFNIEAREVALPVQASKQTQGLHTTFDALFVSFLCEDKCT